MATMGVLLGDVVNSKQAPPDQWQNLLAEILVQYGRYEIFRGDSFQLEMKQPEYVILAAIHIKAAMRSIEHLDIRIAIGLGKNNVQRDDKVKVSQQYSQAHIFSGELFETMRKKTRIAIRSQIKGFDDIINVCLDLASMTMNQWTKSSAEAVKLAIENPKATQKELAEILDITQGRVSERLNRAGYEEVMRMEFIFRKTAKPFI
jgi:predicted XRE-type DNA-binding protein